MNENSAAPGGTGKSPAERDCAYRVLRYTPNLVRDEWLNIGVLLFDPSTGERRLRLIEEQEEYNRVRRLHPQADETLLRALRDDLEDRFQSEADKSSNGSSTSWLACHGPRRRAGAALCRPRRDAARSEPRRGARQPRSNAFLLFASLPASPPVGAH